MPVVLIIDDDKAVSRMLSDALTDVGFTVENASSASEGIACLREKMPEIDVCLLDVSLPDSSGLQAFEEINALDAKLPVIFITGSTSSDIAIQATARGAYDYLVKPVELNRLRDLVSKAVDIRMKMRVPIGIEAHGVIDPEGDQILGTAREMQEVYKAIGRVAAQDVTVLILGESGTGKELVARAIYQHSNRAERPFLAVNCAAIPVNLLESELFGHEKGSFTGAQQRRIGKFEQCNGGTLFLDEIGDMSPDLQGKVLRVLQEQAFERVGGNETIRTDVRIIAATNRDLDTMVENGEFREDLYYRLRGFLICLPPLRERGDDIIMLVQRFINRFNKKLKKQVETISAEALEMLRDYSWPGNIRELENVIGQAVLQATGPVLMPDFLPELDDEAGCPESDEPESSPDESKTAQPDKSGQEAAELVAFIDRRMAAGTDDLYAESLELLERSLLPRVLRATGGNRSQAARVLGITRSSLRNKLRNLNISVERIVQLDDDPLEDAPPPPAVNSAARVEEPSAES